MSCKTSNHSLLTMQKYRNLRQRHRIQSSLQQLRSHQSKSQRSRRKGREVAGVLKTMMRRRVLVVIQIRKILLLEKTKPTWWSRNQVHLTKTMHTSWALLITKRKSKTIGTILSKHWNLTIKCMVARKETPLIIIMNSLIQICWLSTRKQMNS